MTAWTCEQANENYATARVMGSSHMRTWQLLDHAIECQQHPPTHALPQEWWTVAMSERRRKEWREARDV